MAESDKKSMDYLNEIATLRAQLDADLQQAVVTVTRVLRAVDQLRVLAGDTSETSEQRQWARSMLISLAAIQERAHPKPGRELRWQDFVLAPGGTDETDVP